MYLIIVIVNLIYENKYKYESVVNKSVVTTIMPTIAHETRTIPRNNFVGNDIC